MAVERTETRQKRRVPVPVFFLGAALAIGLLLQFGSPNVVDPDGFYHFGWARMFVENGPFRGDFPWAAHSVFADHGSDLWYGFHTLLLPFAWLSDPVFGMKLAGAVLIALSLWLVYAALDRLDVRLAWLWPFVLLFCGAPAALRMAAIRPQGLTLGLLALLFSLLARGGKPAGVFAVSTALSWVHLGMAWLGPVVAVPVLLAGWIGERRLDWRLPAAMFGGLLAGWLLRPNPLNAATLLRVQLYDLQQARSIGEPLLYAGELQAQPVANVALLFLPFLLLWTVGAGILVAAVVKRIRLTGGLAPALWPSLLLSVAAFILFVTHSGRWMDVWRLFVVLFLAVLVSRLPRPHGRLATASGFAAFGLGAWMVINVAGPHGQQMLRSGYSPRRLQPAMEWLSLNSPEGSVVFHTRWVGFGELFFWSRHNRYINGMDPIFMFRRDEARYWQMHHLATDSGPLTAGYQTPQRQSLEDTRIVLRRDFGAQYLLVEKRWTPRLLTYALTNKEMPLAYEDAEVAIFQL
jgi:hypothetical protein